MAADEIRRVSRWDKRGTQMDRTDVGPLKREFQALTGSLDAASALKEKFALRLEEARDDYVHEALANICHPH